MYTLEKEDLKNLRDLAVAHTCTSNHLFGENLMLQIYLPGRKAEIDSGPTLSVYAHRCKIHRRIANTTAILEMHLVSIHDMKSSHDD